MDTLKIKMKYDLPYRNVIDGGFTLTDEIEMSVADFLSFLSSELSIDIEDISEFPKYVDRESGISILEEITGLSEKEEEVRKAFISKHGEEALYDINTPDYLDITVDIDYGVSGKEISIGFEDMAIFSRTADLEYNYCSTYKLAY